MTLTLNRPLGQALKERGMQAALDFSGEAWSTAVLAEFEAWLADQKRQGFKTVTVEAFRAQAQNQPASPNGWGSLPRLAQRAGLIAPHFVAPGIQGRVKAAAPRTHCHEVKQWEAL